MVIMSIVINVLTLMNKKLFITLFLLIPVFCMGMSKNKIVSVDRNGKVKGCTSFIAENDSTFLIDSIRYKLIKNHLEVADCIKKENCSKIKFVYSLNFKGKKYDVTSIGNYVFLFDYILKELEIHKGITCIKPYAFNNCSIQEKIKVDRDNQFYDSRNNCNALIETKTNTLIIGCGNTLIPSDIQRIEQNAFLGNKILRKIKIPKSVKSIGSLAFYKCYNLTKVELPEGLTSLEEGMFQECLSLSDIQIPQSVTTIGAWAFSGCNLESIVLPKGLKRIEGSAFISCKKIKNITLPQSVTYIGKGAFSYCKNLKSVETHAVNVSIEKFAFRNCSSLTTIKVFDKNVKLVIDEEAFSGLGKGQVEIITVKNEHLSKEELQKILNKGDLSRFPWLEIKEGK